MAATHKGAGWRSWLQRLLALLLGLALCLLAFELGLRALGAGFLWLQARQNRSAMASGEAVRVICLGESTTAMGGESSFPSQPVLALNERGEGRFEVLNLGIPAADTSVILQRLERDLEMYEPQVVVAMMGANDVLAPAHDPLASRRAVPDLGVPLTARRGPAIWFKTWLLVRQLRFLRAQREATLPLLNQAAPTAIHRPPPGPDSAPRPACQVFEPELIASLALGEEAMAAFRQAGEHSAQGRCAEAEQALLQALQHDARLGLGYQGLGFCHLQVGSAQLADQAFRSALIFKRGLRFRRLDEDSRQLLERCFQVRDANSDAMEQLSESVVPNPMDPSGSIDLANMLEAQGRHDELRALFSSWRGKGPAAELQAARAAVYYQIRGEEALAQQQAERAQRIRQQLQHSMTARNYQRVQDMLWVRGVKLVAVQYPNRPVEPLQALIAWRPETVLVDNEEVFRRALRETPYEALFWDRCYGDFGHGTRQGNRLLAENVAREVVFSLSSCIPDRLPP